MKQFYSPLQRALLVIFFILLAFAANVFRMFSGDVSTAGLYACMFILFVTITSITKDSSEYSVEIYGGNKFAEFLHEKAKPIILISHGTFFLLGVGGFILVNGLIYKLLMGLLAIGFIINGILLYKKFTTPTK